MRPRLRLAVALLVVAACDGSLLTGGNCTDELSVHRTPVGPIVLRVGASVTPTVALTSCGGRERLADRFTWTIDDATVATVDSASGRTVARAPGTAHLAVTGARFGSVGAWTVTVVP